jgi:hypothetical protein
MPAIAIKPLAFPVATESIVDFGCNNHNSFKNQVQVQMEMY